MSSTPLSALQLGGRAIRNKTNHKTGNYAPSLNKGPRESMSFLDAERIRLLMAEQKKAVEAREAAAAAQAIEWKDLKRTSWTLSRRRLSTYNEDERRVLESRLYHGRNTYHKSDDQLSHELDLDAGDFTDLINSVWDR